MIELKKAQKKFIKKFNEISAKKIRSASSAYERRRKKRLQNLSGSTWHRYLQKIAAEELLDNLDDNFLQELQAHHIEWMGKEFNCLMEGITLNIQQAKSVETIFEHIKWLRNLYGVAQGRNTFKKMCEVLEKLGSMSERELEKIRTEFRELQLKFHQVPDPNREQLFVDATAKYFTELKKIKTKRGYTFAKALYDVNNVKNYIPDKEFNDDFDAILNHYKKWRRNNNISSMGTP